MLVCFKVSIIDLLANSFYEKKFFVHSSSLISIEFKFSFCGKGGEGVIILSLLCIDSLRKNRNKRQLKRETNYGLVSAL